MKIKYKKVKTINEFIDSLLLRVDVFIKELGSKYSGEPDEYDKISRHYIAIINNKVVSTARVRQTSKNVFKIGRMATKEEFRRKGVGKGLLKFIINNLKKQKPKRIWLQSSVNACEFYKRCGFKIVSKPYLLRGKHHVAMNYKNQGYT